MRRRRLITLLGGAITLMWPLASRAQQAERVRRIGVLMGIANDAEGAARVASFRQALEALGWIDGRNVRIDVRWPAAHSERMQAYAAELVGLGPDVILAHTSQVLRIVRHVTAAIPVVFVNVPDPVALGHVASLAQPGGNTTGFTNFETALAGKWLETLKELMPGIARVGVLYEPNNPAWRPRWQLIEAAAPSLGVRSMPTSVTSEDEIDGAIRVIADAGNAGLIVLPSVFTTTHSGRIITAAHRHRLPAVYPFRFFALAGGLIAYGIDVPDQFRQAASYVDRILRGTKPADLPVQAPTKFELVINLKTAKALGLEVPPMLLARADEVIE